MTGELDRSSPAVEPHAAHLEGSGQTPEQRRHLRRILVAFVIVVLLMPVTIFGGAWWFVLVPMVLVAAFALREGIRLRRTVR
jgi:fatty acid desaturase